jgi:predicted nucleic acid-binding protein
MSFVLDASAAATWCFADEQDRAADRAFDRLTTDEAAVPHLWWFEIRNVLIVNERRGRITAAGTAAFLRDLGRLPIRADGNPGERLVMSLARKHRLTVCDAAYLELAVRLDAPIASMDRALSAAARSEGVGIV